MKKYLFIALAALGFAACEEKIGDQPHSGEVEQSYIAINLMSADLDTRAATDSYGYEDGTTAERAIKTAYFFFFDENGNPFNVAANSGATNPDYSNSGRNYLSLSLTANNEASDVNISDITAAVLILNTYKGIYPSKVVAVLNWTPANKTYSLSDLHDVVENSIGNDTNGYVMSNAVYMDAAGNMIDAVPLTTANIKTTPEAAKAAPIDIYVERTAAKVVLTANGKVAGTENIFDTQKNSTPVLLAGTSSEIDVYVKLNGWELYNDYNTSSLLKNINTAWDPDVLGLTWNDFPYYRCYWATSQNTAHNDSFSWTYDDATKAEKGFQTNYGFKVASAADYTDRTTYTYCGENTNGEALRTKVLLKGQLMQKNGENFKPLELARWYGNEYAGNEALRIAVANSLRYKIYSSTNGSNFSPIEPEDIQCVAGVTGTESYEVVFQLSDVINAGKNKTWYKYSSEKGYESLGAKDESNTNTTNTNKYLAENVQPAILYGSGQTYYIVDIKHLGQSGKTAEYGVVRNHVYNIDIKSIKGYGSPVYIGTSNIVTPEYPPYEETSSYVSAKINVLSWKVVKQEVNIVK